MIVKFLESVFYKENIGYYFKMGEKNKSDGDIQILKEIFEDEKIEKISYDIKRI